MDKGKETQDRMEEELDLFASWDEEEEEEALNRPHGKGSWGQIIYII